MCLRGRANDSADILERVPQVEEEMNKDIARWGQQWQKESRKCKWTGDWMCNEFNTGCLPMFQLCLPGEITTMIRGTVAFTRTTLLHLG